MNAERRRLLIGALLVLCTVKFLVVPWVAYQADLRERLALLTQRLDRSAGVILNREAIVSARSRLEAANAVDRARFPESRSLESFRLDSQQRLTALVESQSLRIEAFDWILDRSADQTGFGLVRGRIVVRGDMRVLALLLGSLESELANMVIGEVSFNPETGARGPYDTRATMTLTADYYFRQAKIQ